MLTLVHWQMSIASSVSFFHFLFFHFCGWQEFEAGAGERKYTIRFKFWYPHKRSGGWGRGLSVGPWAVDQQTDERIDFLDLSYCGFNNQRDVLIRWLHLLSVWLFYQDLSVTYSRLTTNQNHVPFHHRCRYRCKSKASRHFTFFAEISKSDLIKSHNWKTTATIPCFHHEQACVAAFAPAAPRMMQRAQVQMNMGNKVWITIIAIAFSWEQDHYWLPTYCIFALAR